MPLVDEESALTLPSPKESLHGDLDERGTSLSYDSAVLPQHEQPPTPMLANATSGFGRHSEKKKKKPPPKPKLLHP